MTPLETVRKFYKGAKSAEINEYFHPNIGWYYESFPENLPLTKTNLRKLASEGVTVVNLHVEDRFGGLCRPDLNINNFDLAVEGVTVDGIKVDLFPHHYGSSSLYFDDLRNDKGSYSELGEPKTYLKWDRHEITHTPPEGEWEEYGDRDYLDKSPTGKMLKEKAKEGVKGLLRAIKTSTPEDTNGLNIESLANGEPVEIEYLVSATRYPKKNSDYRGWLDECGMSETGSHVGGTFAHLTVVDEDIKNELRKLAEEVKKYENERRLISDYESRIWKAKEEYREKKEKSAEIAKNTGTRADAIAEAERKYDNKIKKLRDASEEEFNAKWELDALKAKLDEVRSEIMEKKMSKIYE